MAASRPQSSARVHAVMGLGGAPEGSDPAAMALLTARFRALVINKAEDEERAARWGSRIRTDLPLEDLRPATE